MFAQLSGRVFIAYEAISQCTEGQKLVPGLSDTKETSMDDDLLTV